MAETYAIDEPCPKCSVQGVLHYMEVRVESCSCSPEEPCEACVTAVPICPVCEYEEGDEL